MSNTTSSGEVTLARNLSLFSTTMIGVGAMIGAGIFVLTGTGAGLAGPALMLAFVLNGIATIFTAMVYAELGSSYPDAGGGYLWVKEALPQPAGFLSGWMSWYAHFVACSLYALGFGSYFTHFVAAVGFNFWSLNVDLVAKLMAILVVLGFAYVNHRGASETGLAGNIVTIVKVVVLIAFTAFGLVATFKNPDWWTHFKPFAPNGTLGIVVAMGVTFIGFEGYEIIAQSSEEIINPKRNIPRAVFLSLLIVVPIYVLIAFTAIGGIHVDNMSVWQYLGLKKEMAMVDAASQFVPGGTLVLLFAGLMSTMSALNATIYSSSRVSFAMGRDHNMPDIFGIISPKTRTPTYAILISSIFIIGGIIALPIEDVAAGTVIMFNVLFLLVNISVINLRKNRPDLDRGYVIPWFPGVPIVGIIVKLLLAIFLYELSPIAWYTAIAWIAGGVVFYYAYSRPREHERTVTPLIQEVREPRTRDYNVLVTVSNPKHIKPLADVAAMVAAAKDGAIWGLHAVRVPEILPVGAARNIAMEKQPILEKLADEVRDTGVPFNWMLRATHDVGKAVMDSVTAKDIKLMVMGWPGTIKASHLGKTLDWVLSRTLSDILVVRLPGDGQKQDFRRTVVPVTNTAQAQLTVRLARLLVGPPNQLYFVHVPASRSDDAAVEALCNRLGLSQDEVHVVKPKAESADGPEHIVSSILDFARSVEATGLIIGASREGIVRRRIYGDIPLQLAEGFDGTFVMVKQYPGRVKTYLQEFFGSRPTEHLTDVSA